MDLDLSEQAYLEPNKRSDLIGNFRLDRELSSKTHAVYADTQGGAPKIAFRGTKDADDLGADLAVATGLHPFNTRFRDAEATTDRVRDKFGINPKLTGHSLGGSLALHVTQKRGYESNVYNPGTSIFTKAVTPPGATVNRQAGDLVGSGFDSNPQPLAFRGFTAGDVASTLISHPLRSFRNDTQTSNFLSRGLNILSNIR